MVTSPGALTMAPLWPTTFPPWASSVTVPVTETTWTAGTSVMSPLVSDVIRMLPPASTFWVIVIGLCAVKVIEPVAKRPYGTGLLLLSSTPPIVTGPYWSIQMLPPSASALMLSTEVVTDFSPVPMPALACSQSFGAVTFTPEERPLRMLPFGATRCVVGPARPEPVTVPRTRFPTVSIR